MARGSARTCSSHDRGADAGVALRDEVVVDAFGAALHAVRGSAATGSKRPLVQSRAAHTERVVDALVGPRGVPVE